MSGALFSCVATVILLAASTLSLGASGVLPPSSIAAPILVAFTTNTLSKLVAAFTTGGVRYGISVGSGLVALAVAIWAPFVWMAWPAF